MSYHNTKDWRTQIYVDTKRISGNYPVKDSVKLRFNPSYLYQRKYASTPIVVTDEDTLEAGHRLKVTGHNPLMLNFANDRHPGGGVERGAGAQEESLFRRTNLNLTLLQSLYPIRDYEGIYTSCATIFRDTEERKCSILAKPWQGAFCTVPGVYKPYITPDGMLNERDTARLEKKIHMIIQMGAKMGHDVLVLGALGCGAWGNPPAHVAEIFRYILEDYDGVFKQIVFAVMDRAGSANYREFVNAFR